MKVKSCSNPNCDYVGTLFKSSPALCKNCAMKYNYQNKEKVSENGLNKAREVKKYVIPKFSEKQAKINALYSISRKQFLKDTPMCQVCYDGCTEYATQVHHIVGRGIKTLDTTEWLAVCASCHHEIEMRPEWAKENGYSKNRLDK
jgi:hypothetical protein